MAMLDSFFNKGFKAAKCKTLLKLTIPRIKLLRNRREIQMKQMRREIAKLLETGQEATARIRVEHIIREENMMAAQEILELFCELIAVRLPIIETQRECPLDLKEAISSVCFAAPRCADLPELLQVQMLFTAKYGKEFVLAASELRPDCGVNRQLIELLSIRAPSPEVKLKILKEIAEEHELEWDPASTESEFFKPHEDLLNGPTQFVTESKLPLPAEKHGETLTSAADHAQTEQPDSDSDFDLVDFPEVPNVSLQPSTNAASSLVTNPPSSAAPELEIDHSSKHSRASGHVLQMLPFPDMLMQENIITKESEKPDDPAVAKENKQFLPSISPPSLSASSISARPSDPTLAILKPKSEANFDLEDVLAAAQSAAESAERAAAAARSAANLAQVRIAELKQKKNGQNGEDSFENHLHTNIPRQPASKEYPNFDHLNSSTYPGDVLYSPDSDVTPQDEERKGSESPYLPSMSKLKVCSDSPVSGYDAIEQDQHQKQAQRLPSRNDEYLYPNLFGSGDSFKHNSGSH
ncbi:IST1-LIKE 1 [Hibiscus trionum]|uniref:IST1-LIKE 1 n=1 Tax=Hibiscus trionum TaxID=183268 RepID=A0A9W7I8E4_HIBTR|nr:IST1-LIKE 1 [Hibiscus trionum]